LKNHKTQEKRGNEGVRGGEIGERKGESWNNNAMDQERE